MPLLFNDGEKEQDDDCVIQPIFGDHDWFPQAYIIRESLPRPSVLFAPQPSVSVIISDPMATLWDVRKIIDVRVDSEEVWTVNKAMLDESFWKDRRLEELVKKMEAIDIAKRRAKDNLADL